MTHQPDNSQSNNGKTNGADTKPTYGLSNTMPVATSGLPIGTALGTKFAKEASQEEYLAYLTPVLFPLHEQGASSIRMMFGLAPPTQQTVSPKRPSGEVALFKIIMDEWGFSDKDAATVLGFENVADLRAILGGLRPVGHRDANDRLRAILRVATDLDALYADAAVVRAFLSQPQEKLGGASPRTLLTEGSMENLLLVKYYVAHLSGR